MMRKILFCLALAATATTASAERGGNLYRAGNKVLRPGDTTATVVGAMGDPDSKESVDNQRGAHMGEYWYYRVGNKTVKFFFSGGQVVSIDEIR